MTDHELAQTCLTTNEYAAWNLSQRGLGQRTIALYLNISRSAVQSRLENARRKLHAAKETA
jgi:DNA-binding NarL/FixJ family response regulator